MQLNNRTPFNKILDSYAIIWIGQYNPSSSLPLQLWDKSLSLAAVLCHNLKWQRHWILFSNQLELWAKHCQKPQQNKCLTFKHKHPLCLPRKLSLLKTWKPQLLKCLNILNSFMIMTLIKMVLFTIWAHLEDKDLGKIPMLLGLSNVSHLLSEAEK